MSSPQRLQKILASAGVASRRRSEELILAGRVAINGEIVRELGAKADPEHDTIAVDGTPLPRETGKVYYALYKPTGYITSKTDPKGRRTVMSLAPEVPGLHPVGRLDYDTSGLLLLTNDGDLTLAMTHPRFGVPKTYEALVEGHPTERILQRLRDGIRLEDGFTASAKVVGLGAEGAQSRVRITIHEGRNRQVRRMFAAIGHPVMRLKRLSVGTISIDGISLGGYRALTPQEVVALKQQTGHEEGQS